MYTSKTVCVGGLLFDQIYSAEQLQQIVCQLGKQINDYYGSFHRDKSVIVLCILKGAFMFCADLIRCLNFPIEMEFLKLQSYIGMQSGEITMEKILSPEVFEGRHVLVVEDIHDTGKTLKKIIEELQKLNTAKVDIAVLVRRTENPFEIDLKFTGIVCSEFIIGYGLDYNGLARYLPALYQKNPTKPPM